MSANAIAQRHSAMPDRSSPASGGTVVTPNDAVDLPHVAAFLWIGGAGDVAVTTEDGDNLTFTCPAGSYIWWRVRRVLSAGTDATQIIAAK